MADLVFVLIIVGFFALMVLLVRACDHVIGPDPIDLGAGGAGSVDDRTANASEVSA